VSADIAALPRRARHIAGRREQPAYAGGIYAVASTPSQLWCAPWPSHWQPRDWRWRAAKR